MSRIWFAVFLVAFVGITAPLAAQDVSPEGLPSAMGDAHGTWADEIPMGPPDPAFVDGRPQTLSDYAVTPGFMFDAPRPPNDYLPMLKWFGLRHSHTHGRHVGRGGPLSGTSWLNRPYYVGGELGGLWLTRPVHDDVSTDADAFGGLFLGWDRDHYWGAELRFNWATPELKNSEARDADRTDSLFEWSYNLLYYPWGDAMWRPYWRAGIGDAHYDFPLDDGSRHDQWMLTFPLGFGVKYPVRPWLAARAEIADHIGVGHGELDAQHNVALTMGLEWRFGAHPRSYWPWNPSRHIW